MGYTRRPTEEARYSGLNNMEWLADETGGIWFHDAPLCAPGPGGFVSTCERCGVEFEVLYGERVLHLDNHTLFTPLHPTYEYCCSYCIDELNDAGEYELPGPRGLEDEVVRWGVSEYHGGEAYGEVLREDEPNVRGNLLVYRLYPVDECTDHGARFQTLWVESVERTTREAVP